MCGIRGPPHPCPVERPGRGPLTEQGQSEPPGCRPWQGQLKAEAGWGQWCGGVVVLQVSVAMVLDWDLKISILRDRLHGHNQCTWACILTEQSGINETDQVKTNIQIPSYAYIDGIQTPGSLLSLLPVELANMAEGNVVKIESVKHSC